MVSLEDSPLGEMTVTVGLDMVAVVGVAWWVSIALESEIVRMKNGFVCGQAPWRHVPNFCGCERAKTKTFIASL